MCSRSSDDGNVYAVRDRVLHAYYRYPLAVHLVDANVLPAGAAKPHRFVELDAENSVLLTPK